MLKRGYITFNSNITKLIALVFVTVFTVSCFSKGNSKSSGGGASSSSSSTTTTTPQSGDTTAPAVIASWAMSSPNSASTSNDATPVVSGSGGESGATVKLYSSSNCSTAVLGSGTVAGDGTFSISAFTVSTQGANAFYHTIEDASANVSACTTTGLSYTFDSVAPGAPTSFTMSSPNSGTYSSDATPALSGTGGEASAVIKVYSNITCTSAVLQTGTVAGNGTFSITAFTVAGVGVKSFYYTIEDTVGNVSACMNPTLSYTYDNVAPTGGSITVAEVTNTQDITVNLSATETVSTPALMCVGETADCSSCTYETYATTKAVTLSNGVGVKNLSVKFKDAAANESACYTTSIIYEQVTVSPRYEGASNWTHYVKSADTSIECDGSEAEVTDCIHAGDKKRVTTTETSCTGLSMVDNYGVFDWSCSLDHGVAVFDSRLKEGKGIKDVIDFTEPQYYDFKVTMTGGTPATQESYARAWWTNSLNVLTDFSSEVELSEQSIYLINGSYEFVSFRISTDHVAIVSNIGKVLTHKRDVAVCDPSNASPGAESCMIYANRMHFSWIEIDNLIGDFDSDTTAYGIIFYQGNFNKVLNTSMSHINRFGLFLNESNYGTFSKLRIADVYGDGAAKAIYLLGACDNNLFKDVNISNSLNSVFIDADARKTYMQGLIISGTRETPIYSTSSYNHFTAVTIMNSQTGFTLKGNADNIIHNLASINSYNLNAFEISNNSSSHTLSQMAIDNTANLTISNSDNIKFTGVLMLTSNTNCSVSGGTDPGLVNGTCANQGLSNSDREDSDFSGDFLAKVTTNDTQNTSDTNGVFTYDDNVFNDFLNFDSFYRAIGKNNAAAFPDLVHANRCEVTRSCQIWDMALKSSGSKILNKSVNPSAGSNDAFTNGAACPAGLTGNDIIANSSNAIKYLKNAVEIIGDESGNENGICEENETCMYTPNFGAYQGHGSLGSCTFTDGTIGGITMKGYLSNGY